MNRDRRADWRRVKGKYSYTVEEAWRAAIPYDAAKPLGHPVRDAYVLGEIDTAMCNSTGLCHGTAIARLLSIQANLQRAAPRRRTLCQSRPTCPACAAF